jgi:hypothetical protein
MSHNPLSLKSRKTLSAWNTQEGETLGTKVTKTAEIGDNHVGYKQVQQIHIHFKGNTQ